MAEPCAQWSPGRSDRTACGRQPRARRGRALSSVARTWESYPPLPLGRCPSGQREQTVNLPANASGGSNPPRPTLPISRRRDRLSGSAGGAGCALTGTSESRCRPCRRDHRPSPPCRCARSLQRGARNARTVLAVRSEVATQIDRRSRGRSPAITRAGAPASSTVRTNVDRPRSRQSRPSPNNA